MGISQALPDSDWRSIETLDAVFFTRVPIRAIAKSKLGE
jgi:hypothetical protein